MFRQAFPSVLLAAFLIAPASAGAAGRGDAPGVRAAAAAGNTQFLMFNLAPAGGYEVSKNGAAGGSFTAGPAGSLVYEADAAPGDRFEFLLTGIEPVSPAIPSAFVAAGNSEGCVLVSWNTPAPGDYVNGYTLVWGRSGGAYTDSIQVSRLDVVNNGGKSWHTRCGFASGTYQFAVRAHNSFDRWSALSAPSTTTISNENTQGPVPPTNVKVSETTFGCATVTWTRSSDPTVVGYRVYLGTKPRTQAAYTDSIDAGNASFATKCALAQGAYYFAVRSMSDLGLMSGYSKEVSLAAQGVDVTGPAITQRTPSPGATNVPLNATIFFVATDDKTGVNADNIDIKVNGQACAYTVTHATGGFAVQCDPAGDFAPLADVTVEITVSDHASPANATSRTWTFRTGTEAVSDVDAPVLSAAAPLPGATEVDPRPTIEVNLSDAGLGVSLGSIVLRVNGEAVDYTVSGTPAAAKVSFRPEVAFSAGAEVTVRVDACDRAPVPNCAAPLEYRFTVRAAALAEQSGAIVPDGFWANDPARPLEVRNLPRDWSVRIFDAAGLSVRRHVNREEGATWAWDFTNDDGRRVAPALYLVRVTDSGGSVQKSGRFLVQSAR